ncbi:uracil-DNA glycosylase family protein [Microvirga tunisiensis]
MRQRSKIREQFRRCNAHLGDDYKDGLTETVRRWRDLLGNPQKPRILPLPHPSWRNNGWLKKNPWFEAELLPVLQA